MVRIICLVVAVFVLAACQKTSNEPTEGGSQPASKEKTTKSRKQLISEIDKQEMPALKAATDVEKFVAWAAQAPVSKREIIRERITKEKSNTEVATGLVTHFKKKMKTDHSSALVILALLGELRSENGFKFLSEFVWQKLPNTGPRDKETNVPMHDYNQILLQVKAVNGMAYMKTRESNQALLKVISRHPTAAVRAEAIAAFLYNNKFSAEAKKQLSQVVQKKDQIYIDRPVRTDSMTVAEFNKSIQVYLKNHPELKPPSPEKLSRSPVKGTPSEPKLKVPPQF